jgi:outer membrane protein assembly factor BamB
MRTLLACCLASSFLLLSTSSASAQIKSGDWPQWRGPQRDAICIETGLLKEWPKAGPTLLWDSRKVNGGKSVGIGFSSLAITQGKIFTLGDRKPDKLGGTTGEDGCFVFCLDADTGKEIWKAKIGSTTNYGGYAGPRCIPTVDDDRLYAIHPDGILVCLKVKDGALLWQKEFLKEFGVKGKDWGYCESPTIDGDKLLCTPCANDAVMVAMNKMTGDVLWRTKLPAKVNIGGGCGYSSIVSAEAGGVKQYLNVTGNSLGLMSVDAKTGKFLWSYNKAVKGTANIPTAVVQGDYVFTSTGYGAGAALLKLTSDAKGNVKAEEEYFLSRNSLEAS